MNNKADNNISIVLYLRVGEPQYL